MLRIYLAEAHARLEAACEAPVGFVERLVAFWSNHFCISAAKGQIVRITAGAFEREAIRPFVLGRFVDMLQAVERHPAMLHFLDNVQSVGPNSRAGQNSKRGLNENLAREILELHTLGVDGGYTQTDVTEFARVLTGWTVVGREGKLGEPGAFVFNANAHEGGERNLLGRRYPKRVSHRARPCWPTSPVRRRRPDISRESLRGRSLPTCPPAPLVDRLTEVFRQDRRRPRRIGAGAGDRRRGAWSAPPTKLRDPWQMLVAAYRALALDPCRARSSVVRALTLLGMPLWTPAGPNGFPDVTDAWLSPEGVKTRVESPSRSASLAKEAPRPRDLLDRVLPDASLIRPARRYCARNRPSRPTRC